MGQSTPINTGAILIVEDEAIVRFELVDVFEDAGYHVFEAESADEAIEVLARERSIHIVLTDVQMPGSIRERYPRRCCWRCPGPVRSGNLICPNIARSSASRSIRAVCYGPSGR